MLVNHQIAPVKPGQQALYSYIMAGNGIFLEAQRPGISLRLPIADCVIRGLPTLSPEFNWTYPKVPKILTSSILQQAIDAEGLEILFYLSYDPPQGWQLDCPAQEQGVAHCRPLEDNGNSPYAQALINVHSHHKMAPNFSKTDDGEDQGFRIYGIVGDLGTQPKLRVRVGVYGYFWEVAATTIFELPDGLIGASLC